MAWIDDNQALNSAIIAAFGQTVVYSRPSSPTSDGLAPFNLSVSIETGPGYQEPTSKFMARVLADLSQIPGGPQKGDLMVITPGLHPGSSSETYSVGEIYRDPETSTTYLLIRWTGQ